MEPQLSTYHDPQFDIQQPFDIAVVIPTICRESLAVALRSIFLQDYNGRVHILLGIDNVVDKGFNFEALLCERPKNMALTLLWPGYSTNKKRGGMHSAMGGGSLRSLLSFLGNAHYVTYLDDDNWFSPNHLSTLHSCIQGKKWAFSRRWFVDEITHQPLCEDSWESVGPNQGVFASNFGGFVDTNCLMIDTLACATHLSTWCRALSKYKNGRGADRQFFKRLKELKPFGDSQTATVSYITQRGDHNQKARLNYIDKHNISCGITNCKDWASQPKKSLKRRQKSCKSGRLSIFGKLDKSFDISVIIPTIGRTELLKSIYSIFEQTFSGRVQILIGIDKIINEPLNFADLTKNMPDNMTLMVFDPGYSTSTRHGGVFEAHDGGALRTILSYLANAPYVAYLDDDNTWKPTHLSTLFNAIQNKNYAYSLREFIHPDGKTPISIDYWESVGPKKGFFAFKYNGFIDPNCLMLNIAHCLNSLPLWTRPLIYDPTKLSADRVIFHFLYHYAQGKSTKIATSNYVINSNDPMHELRRMYLGHRWINADLISLKNKLLNGSKLPSQKR